jgi:hypothetical protein
MVQPQPKSAQCPAAHHPQNKDDSCPEFPNTDLTHVVLRNFLAASSKRIIVRPQRHVKQKLKMILKRRIIFWVVRPCNLETSLRSGEIYCLHFRAKEFAKQETKGSRWHSCCAYSSTLKMEATCLLDTLVSFQII